jgi:hypothetical protein
MIGASANGLGVRSVRSYAPDTTVLVIINNNSSINLGFIVSAFPNFSHNKYNFQDWISLASRSGARVDELILSSVFSNSAHKFPDCTSGRPIDGLNIGEEGFCSGTGMKLTLDDFMGQFSVDEYTGLFLFYGDQKLRISGLNFQQRDISTEYEALLDSGEIHTYRGFSVYPWEGVGAYKNSQLRTREFQSNEVQIGQDAYYSYVEPAQDRQRPFHRRIQIGGYIGNGWLDSVMAPPKSVEPEDVATYGRVPKLTEQAETTLSIDHTLMTGERVVSSVKGIHLRIDPLLPSLMKLKRPEDSQGDNNTNYRPSGVGPNGKEHKIVAKLNPEKDDPFASQRVALAHDEYLTYLTNYQRLLPLHRHELDWKIEEQTEVAKRIPAFGTDKPKIPYVDYDHLNGYSELQDLESYSVHVDHRYGDIKCYPASYGLSVHDGLTTLSGAFNEIFQFKNGNLIIDLPANLIIRTGMNIILQGGNDIIAKAYNNLDMSAIREHVFIKAQKDFRCLAGNDETKLDDSGGESTSPGKGGFIFEVKSTNTADFENKEGAEATAAGFLFKSPGTPFIIDSKDYYLKASQQIVFDAGKELLVKSPLLSRFIGSAADYFNGGSITMSSSGLLLSGGMTIGGPAAIDGSLTVNGSIRSINGGISATQAASGKVGEIDPKSAVDYSNAIKSKLAAVSGDSSKEAFTKKVTDGLYGDAGIGSPKKLKKIGFSFRTTKQYRLLPKKFKIAESAWQRSARLQSKRPGAKSPKLRYWVEQPVVLSDKKYYPWPGEIWADKEAKIMLQLGTELIDETTGLAKNRTDLSYQNPKLPKDAKEAVVPNGNYIILCDSSVAYPDDEVAKKSEPDDGEISDDPGQQD